MSGAHPPLAYPLHSQIEKYSHSFDKPVLSVVERLRTRPPSGRGRKHGATQTYQTFQSRLSAVNWYPRTQTIP